MPPGFVLSRSWIPQLQVRYERRPGCAWNREDTRPHNFAVLVATWQAVAQGLRLLLYAPAIVGNLEAAAYCLRDEGAAPVFSKKFLLRDSGCTYAKENGVPTWWSRAHR